MKVLTILALIAVQAANVILMNSYQDAHIAKLPEQTDTWLAKSERSVHAGSFIVRAILASSCATGPGSITTAEENTIRCTFVKEFDRHSDIRYRFTFKYTIDEKVKGTETNVSVSIAICKLDLLAVCTSVPYLNAKSFVDGALDDLEQRIPKKVPATPVTPPPPPIVKR